MENDTSSTSNLKYYVIGSTILFGAVIASKLFFKKKKKKKVIKRIEQLPKMKQTGPPPTPGKGTPIFAGLRVIDLATHVAAPTASRVMAELGAEVIKIENISGDIFRKTLLEFETTRTFASIFETSNVGKYGISMNLKTGEGLEQLFDLCKDADVLITNIRSEVLERLGLSYSKIKEKFPQLVYAQVSAWGLAGPESHLPGYDIGSFYAATGVASVMQYNQTYSTYPPGFGDLSTGQALLAGIGMALKNRLKTGNGMFVTSTLLKVGIWALAPHIIKAQREDRVVDCMDIPNYDHHVDSTALSYFYKTKDDTYFLIASDDDEKCLDMIKVAFGLDESKKIGQAALQKIFGTMEYQAVAFSLAQVGIEISRVRTDLDIHLARKDTELPGIESMFHYKTLNGEAVDMDGLARVPKIPYNFSCSKQHGISMRAPGLGQHNDAIKVQRWSEVHPDAKLPMSSSKEDENIVPLPLEGVTIVELIQGSDVCLSAATCMLRDQGATVIKIELKGGDKLRSLDPITFAQFNRGKKSIELDLKQSQEDRQKVFDIVMRSNMLVTDLNNSQLVEFNLDYQVLSQLHQTLVYLKLSSFPSSAKGKDATKVGCLGSIYAETGIASQFRGSLPEVQEPAAHMFEIIASYYCASAMSIALFHQDRTGEGQLTEVNYQHIGVWLGTMVNTWNEYNAEFVKNMAGTGDVYIDYISTPIATYNSYRTKDGMQVQLLGLDLKRHIGALFSALNIKLKVLPKILWAVFAKVLPNRNEKNKIKKLMPVFHAINEMVIDKMASLTWLEVRDLFDKHGVWYCTIRTPDQIASCPQAKAIGSFVGKGDQFFIGSPVELSTKQSHFLHQGETFPEAPKLNADAKMQV